jgi:hypothetical protein
LKTVTDLKKHRLPALTLLAAIAIGLNGIREYAIAHPSPHFYIELFIAMPQIAMGMFAAIGSLLAFVPIRWIRLLGLTIAIFFCTLALLFYLTMLWFLLSGA